MLRSFVFFVYDFILGMIYFALMMLAQGGPFVFALCEIFDLFGLGNRDIASVAFHFALGSVIGYGFLHIFFPIRGSYRARRVSSRKDGGYVSGPRSVSVPLSGNERLKDVVASPYSHPADAYGLGMID